METRKKLIIAIIISAFVLVAAIAAAVILGLKPNQNAPTPPVPTGTEVPSNTTPGGEVTVDPTVDVTKPAQNNLPTEDKPLMLGDDLYIVRMGNYSGRYVEDGSDVQLDSFCAVVVENRGTRTVQLAKFQVKMGTQTYQFSLTTLPPGTRAIVQELNRLSFTDSDASPLASVETLVFFYAEPSLHEDVFSISGAENGIELYNRSDDDISGPIYVYYKTRNEEGFVGGITYRVTFPEVKAGETSFMAVNHFWAGSSQVMFVDYAD